MRLRSELHSRGLRFRKDYVIQGPDLRVRVDIAFPRSHVAVFVDGCFWHGCPVHGTTPRANVAYWTAKLARNRNRDALVDARLKTEGWTVLRVWEHEEPADAASLVAEVLEPALPGERLRGRAQPS